jgi:hypothetical protein
MLDVENNIFNIVDGFDVADMWYLVLCRGGGGSWFWMLHATRVATWIAWVLCRVSGRRTFEGRLDIVSGVGEEELWCWMLHTTWVVGLLTANNWVASNPTTAEVFDARVRSKH